MTTSTKSHTVIVVSGNFFNDIKVVTKSELSPLKNDDFTFNSKKIKIFPKNCFQKELQEKEETDLKVHPNLEIPSILIKCTKAKLVFKFM